MDQKSYLNLEEVAGITNKSIQTLRRLIKKGDLLAKRIKTPQGFQYVVNPEALSKLGYIIPQKLMFSNSAIQNEILPQSEAIEDVSPYQAENLYSRIDLEPLKEEDFYHLDIQDFKTLQNNISSSHNIQTGVAQVEEKESNRSEHCANIPDKQQVCAHCANLEKQIENDRLKIETLTVKCSLLENEVRDREVLEMEIKKLLNTERNKFDNELLKAKNTYKETNDSKDKFAKELSNKYHIERIFFLHLIERLQNELWSEREKRYVFVNVFRRLSNRIKLAIKKLSS